MSRKPKSLPQIPSHIVFCTKLTICDSNFCSASSIQAPTGFPRYSKRLVTFRIMVGPTGACIPSAFCQLDWFSSVTNREEAGNKNSPRSLFSLINHVGGAYYIFFVLYFYGAHHHSNKAQPEKQARNTPKWGWG